MQKFIIVFILIISCIVTRAQKSTITGTVYSAHEKEKLQYSNIIIIRKVDSVIISNARADGLGKFKISGLEPGYYNVIISYPKMADYIANIIIKESSNNDLGLIPMDLKANLLEEVRIIAAKQAITRKKDTITYQADSFKVAEHANVGELLRRLPGIEVDINGNITAQGESVKKILVDGDEFFGDDPLMVTKYLKAKGVSEVQVYDKRSKESVLTGIEDGKKEKIINVKLKENAKNGYISEVDLKSSLFKYNDDGILAGLYIKKLRVAVFAQKTNLNTTSFAGSSFSKFSTTDNYFRIETNEEGIPGTGSSLFNNLSGSGLPDNFKVSGYFSEKWKNNGQANLISNYSDNSNENFQSARTELLLPNGSVLKNFNSNTSNSRNKGQDFKATASVDLDSMSNVKIDVSAKQNHNENQSVIETRSLGSMDELLSQNTQNSSGSGNADLFSGNINYSKRFHKKGRSITIDIQPESNRGSGNQVNLNNLNYYDENGKLIENRVSNLRKAQNGTLNSIAGRVGFTEPINENFSLQTAYSFKANYSTSAKQVFNNSGVGATAVKIDSLSNDFKYNSINHIGKATLQYKYQNLTATTGMELTNTKFALEDRDVNKNFSRNYINIAPNTLVSWKPSLATNLNFSYIGITRQPSITQLQPIRDVDNPLYEFNGNPDLKPSFRNAFSLSFNKFTKQFTFLSVGIAYESTNDAIVTVQSVDKFNKTKTSYINANGNKDLGATVGYGFNFMNRKFTVNTNLNYSRNDAVSILNDRFNKVRSNNYSLRGNLKYGTPRMYFAASSFVSLRKGISTIGSLNSSRTFSHSHQLEANVKLPFKIEFNSSAVLSFRPADASFTSAFNTYQLNGFLAKKLLKNESLEIRISANDILNQQTGYSRTVGGNSTSELTYSYIPRFFLLGLKFNMSGNFITNDKNK